MLFCLICYRAHAQAAANMQQQQQQHAPGGLPPGMIHPTSHSPLQLQPPGPTQPHVPGPYLGSGVAQKFPKPGFLVCFQYIYSFISESFLLWGQKSVLSFHCIFFESGSKFKTPTYLSLCTSSWWRKQNWIIYVARSVIAS